MRDEAGMGDREIDMTKKPAAFGALIFDLDGTLIDSAPDIAAAVNAYLRSRGWPEQETEFVERFIGNGPRRLLLDMLVELGLPSDDETIAAAHAAYLAHYGEAPARLTKFYSHVREDLTALKQAGFRLGICTNKPHALTLRVLDLLGIAPLFDAVLGADAVPACKPDPGHLLAVAKLMQLADGEWAYVGDTTVDQATAIAADAPFFVVPWGGGKLVPTKPEQRLTRLLDLLAYRPVQQAS
ncbi:HAD-IA family hydrolase [Kaistia terrae]|uniref:phosphoglycolate phosphatase n=1 Tax=Kaistia terrae TaxID=537017 RepID=A0ABW0PPN7_9HYPH|nr:HAD-IA family hydrolase [Kaistia terrae]MCX5577818.1 HAD-IA family hydrolase [Kaistia terrae]